MILWPLPILVATAVAAVILSAGGIESTEMLLFATVSGGAFAFLVRRARRDPGGGAADPTAAVFAAGFLVILVAAAYDRGRVGAPPWDSFSLRWVGIAVIGAGIALRALATRELGAGYSVRLGIREGHRLIETGPYRWIRHPNYAALLLIAVGLALAWASRLAVATTALVWAPILFVRIRREEQMMLERFGDAYRRYMRRTARLVPGLY